MTVKVNVVLGELWRVGRGVELGPVLLSSRRTFLVSFVPRFYTLNNTATLFASCFYAFYELPTLHLRMHASA
jgi:hypothetical protein